MKHAYWKDILRMLAAVAAVVVWCAVGTPALAKGEQGGFSADPRGGFAGPGPNVTTVEQALTMEDDSVVFMKGHIMRSLGGDRYIFRDSSGEIELDISSRRWRGQRVTPDDVVEVHGEVDRDDNKVEIDVKKLVRSENQSS